MSASSGLRMALALASLAISALAGAEGPEEPTPAGAIDFARLPTGARVVVTGKYKELLDQEMFLFECDVPFLLKSLELRKKVLDFKAQRDNVLIRGTLQVEKTGTTRVVIDVEQLGPAPSDFEVHSRSVAQALAAGAETSAAPLRKALKAMLTSFEQHQDLQLVTLFRSSFLELIQRESAANHKQMLAEHLTMLARSQELFRRKELPLELAVALRGRVEDTSAVHAFLIRLGCRQYGGSWVTYEQFKEREGLVLHNGAWVQRREKHISDALERLRGSKQAILIVRRRTDREYELLAQKGIVEEGMKPEEVCTALGFPDRVERRMYQQKELTQWTFGEKFYYFYDSVLLTKASQ